jgi:DNA helicase-2/ATP-dependent DNA helicase PcrA
MALIGKQVKEKPEISTFHSLCVRILRRHIRHLGYPAAFAIYDRGDQEGVARSALREIRVAEAVLRPGDLLYLIGRWKNGAIGPEQASSLAQTDKEHLAAAAYRRYQNSLKAVGAVDFDDLLLLAEDLFDRFPKVRQEEAGRFDHLLVDEYQDTNGSQYRIVKALADAHRNLCVVGDDDQSIYGWRGAEVAHILRFSQDWPDAKVVRLETNYRSTHQILAWANRLIAFNKLRHDKVLRAIMGGPEPRILQLKDEVTEAKTVVSEIAARIRSQEASANDFAILFRTNEQPRAFEMELRKAKVPYVLVGGQSFYDRKEVRDILAYLKLLANPLDEIALLRIINTPARGIGQQTVTRLTEHAIAHGQPIWKFLTPALAIPNVPPAAARGIAQFVQMIQSYRQRIEQGSLVEAARALIGTIGYRDELARLYPEPDDRDARWGAVEEVINALSIYCQRHPRPDLSGFLQETLLTGREEDSDKEEKLNRNAVVLMTLHAAKGLEFSEVYLVGMEEELLPHKRSVAIEGAAIDEERRLCYVGITRAKRRLTLSLSLSRQKWGKARPTVPSRFLYEITGQTDNPHYRARGRKPAAKGKR